MSAVLSFILGALTTAFLRGWQYKHEHWIGRASSLVKLAAEIADQAAKYWCGAHSTEAKDVTENRVLETAILGKLIQLDGLFKGVERHLEPNEATAIKDALTEFHDATSGGDFGALEKINFQSGYERARRIHAAVADLVCVTHSAVDEAMRHNFWGRAFWRTNRR
ncbi:MAG: hypothetical protein IOC63_20285 [Methylobacterium sp.]|nr:hypothetical protein [Rhodocyclaceae bacterium]MCA3596222.1 hypothetical protein [Methylobacterium sp.]MCA3602605.1 hypothetical protein [Methylobacterium sp.]MCA3613442.1 hypothetical protein [Methylobacterium sp.]MCA3613677.1 hypothetical protein [Methylobacterium sp.]